MIKMTHLTPSALFLASTICYRDRLFAFTRVRFCQILLYKNYMYEKTHNTPVVDFSVSLFSDP